MFSSLRSDQNSGTEASTTHSPLFQLHNHQMNTPQKLCNAHAIQQPSQMAPNCCKIYLAWQSFRASNSKMYHYEKKEYFKYRLLLSKIYHWRHFSNIFIQKDIAWLENEEAVSVFPQHPPPKYSPFWWQIINRLTRWRVLLEIHSPALKLTTITLSIIEVTMNQVFHPQLVANAALCDGITMSVSRAFQKTS